MLKSKYIFFDICNHFNKILSINQKKYHESGILRYIQYSARVLSTCKKMLLNVDVLKKHECSINNNKLNQAHIWCDNPLLFLTNSSPMLNLYSL